PRVVIHHSMPELPEVEALRRGLALRMTGRQIVQAELRRPDLRRPFPPMLAERLDGARIGALSRRGKYILIELDESGTLLLHLGMSGRITAGAADVPPEPHDHVVLTLDDGTVVRFNDARRFDPPGARRGDRGRRFVIARLCAGERRARLLPAPLGGLRQGGRALPRLHLRRGGTPHRAVRPFDVLLRQTAALGHIAPGAVP